MSEDASGSLGRILLNRRPSEGRIDAGRNTQGSKAATLTSDGNNKPAPTASVDDVRLDEAAAAAAAAASGLADSLQTPTIRREPDTIQGETKSANHKAKPGGQHHNQAHEHHTASNRPRATPIGKSADQLEDQVLRTSQENLRKAAEGVAGKLEAPGSDGLMLDGFVEQVPHNRHLHGINERSPFVSSEANRMLLFGAPIVACLMLAFVFFWALNYCRQSKPKCCGKRPSPPPHETKASAAKSTIINFISNGKPIAAKAQDVISGKRRLSDQRQKQSAFADCRQLTINMEADLESSQSSANTATTGEDSDERQGVETQRKWRQKKAAAAAAAASSTSYGRLKYSLSYDFALMELTVAILEARDLPAMDFNGFSDPYVKLELVSSSRAPANSDRRQAASFRTRIHKRTLNPVFNESFKFNVAYAELASKTLVMSMFDYDRLSRHDEMGQTSVAMHSIDLAREQVNWVELGKPGEGRLGDICLSLRYVPTAGKLNVVVLEARQLKKMDLAGLSDPYVKVALMSKGKRLKKKKTSIKKCTLNPHYNESFSFEIPFELVQEVQLTVTVVDYDRIGTSEPIGKITLGCQQTTGDTELRHWLDMLASPRRPIAQWHSLKDVGLQAPSASQVGASCAN